MPSKNSIKVYSGNGYYHIYNRGVEKRKIFLDQQDYAVFLSYLKEYLVEKDDKKLQEKLSDPKIDSIAKDKILKTLRLNNFSDEITFIAFCLMPNHFHFFVKQKNQNAIDRFMRSICTRYTMYFNKKYNRVGSLYQGVYKAVLIENENQFLHLSRYIHKQALALQGETLEGWEGQPSSYMDYVGERNTEWVKPNEILAFFSQENPSLSYASFVKDQDDLEILSEKTLEEN